MLGKLHLPYASPQIRRACSVLKEASKFKYKESVIRLFVFIG